MLGLGLKANILALALTVTPTALALHHDALALPPRAVAVLCLALTPPCTLWPC